MRRFVLGLGLLLAGAGVVLFSGCSQPNNVLRVASVNKGMPVMCDIADWAVWNDPTIPDSEEDIGFIYQIQNDSAEVEFQYVEIGAGLPTLTPYHAVVTEYTIDYTSEGGGGNSYQPATIPTTVDVLADREAKKSIKVNLVLATAWWKQQHFGDDIDIGPSTEPLPLDIVRADIEFTAVDSVLGKSVKATAVVQLQFGDFYDNPEKIGN